MRAEESRIAMLNDYMDKAKAKAMPRAEYRRLEDGAIVGSIPGFQGVWANADSESECAPELREVLEGWLLLAIAKHDSLPEVDGMKLDVGKPAFGDTLATSTCGMMK